MFWIEEKLPKPKHPDLDLLSLMQELDSERQEYLTITKSSIQNLYVDDNLDYYKSIVPVGDLSFVQTVLSKIHDIDHMNPIEVPEVLRKDAFLKRKYSIRKKSDLPKEGYYFVKNASQLKDFSYNGEIAHIHEGPQNDYCVHFKDDCLYQLSEVVFILSEYRVFVHQDKIIGIHYYDGECDILPDIHDINFMVDMYKLDNDRPEAYTMDIAVIKNRGTAILEVHPWVSVGLYGYMFNGKLPYCYIHGFDYYKTINKPIEEWSNF